MLLKNLKGPVMNKYVFILLLIVGCSEPRNKIYAIDKEDMLRVPVANARIEWDDTNDIPGDLWFTNEPGWFISDEILKQVYEKKYSDEERLPHKERLKRSRFLQQRGFSNDMIKTLF